MKRDWDIVTSSIDSVGPSNKTVSFPKMQDTVKVTNKGNVNLNYTIGTKSGTLAPNGSITVKENLTSFTVKAEVGIGLFEVWATEEGTEQEESTPTLPSDISGKLEELSSSVAQKANFRQVDNEISPNMLAGYEGNAVANNLYSCTIAGGGTQGRENLIGATENMAIGTHDPNVMDNTTDARYSVIGGGYDNIANGLASVLTGFHCLIRKPATHGTISGGSGHEISAGDYGTIAGGTLNKVATNRSTISGGHNNLIDTNNGGAIGGGGNNKVQGAYGTVGGGTNNESTGIYTSINGGYFNKSTGDSATIGGGRLNTASGAYAVVNGGESNIASGERSLVMGGRLNTASEQNSAVIYGEGNTAAGINSTASGFNAKSIARSQQAFADGKFSQDGDAQFSSYIFRKQTTTGTGAALGFANGAALPQMPDKAAWLCTFNVVAKSATAEGEVKAFKVVLLAENKVGVNVALIGAAQITTLFESTGTTTWAVATTAGGNSIGLIVTGETGKTINWVAKLETVEVIA
jgi:hypothetical protein